MREALSFIRRRMMGERKINCERAGEIWTKTSFYRSVF